MSHANVLKKKEARLLKHTGRKLVLKRRALEKALARAGKAAPKTERSLDKTIVEKADPTWTIITPGGASFTVKSTSEKAARAAARKALKIRALPAGTKVTKRG